MAKTDNFEDFLVDLANTIREKKGTTDLINPQDFSQEIYSIDGGGQSGDSEKYHYYKILNGNMASEIFGGGQFPDGPGFCQINSTILDGYMITTAAHNYDSSRANVLPLSDILEKCTALSISDSPNTIVKFYPNLDGYNIIKISEGDIRQKLISFFLIYVPEEELNSILGEVDALLDSVVQKISKEEYEALITN